MSTEKHSGAGPLLYRGPTVAERIAAVGSQTLSDPVTQTVLWMELPSALSQLEDDSVILKVALRPDVTDSVAEQLVRATHEMGLHGVHRAATGQRFILCFDEDTDPILASQSIAKSLLANNVIQHWTMGEITPSFPEEVSSSGTVEIIPVRNLSDEELLALSKDRRAALDLTEMQTIEPRVDGFFVKEAVLPFKKLPGSSSLLGPKRHSTGEVLQSHFQKI